jgi:hypothetical protein
VSGYCQSSPFVQFFEELTTAAVCVAITLCHCLIISTAQWFDRCWNSRRLSMMAQNRGMRFRSVEELQREAQVRLDHKHSLDLLFTKADEMLRLVRSLVRSRTAAVGE